MIGFAQEAQCLRRPALEKRDVCQPCTGGGGHGAGCLFREVLGPGLVPLALLKVDLAQTQMGASPVRILFEGAAIMPAGLVPNLFFSVDIAEGLVVKWCPDNSQNALHLLVRRISVRLPQQEEDVRIGRKRLCRAVQLENRLGLLPRIPQRGSQPDPGLVVARLLRNGHSQARDGPPGPAQLHIIDTEKQIRASQARLCGESFLESLGRCVVSILEIIHEPEIHPGFRQVRLQPDYRKILLNRQVEIAGRLRLPAGEKVAAHLGICVLGGNGERRQH